MNREESTKGCGQRAHGVGAGSDLKIYVKRGLFLSQTGAVGNAELSARSSVRLLC